MIRSPLLVIACVLTAMQTASADPRRVVAVLDVHVDGVAPEVAAQFQSSLEAQVDAKHYRLAPRARVRDSMANSTRWTDGCVVGICLAEVKAKTGADLVLLAALTGSGTSFGFVVTLVRTDTGRVLAQEAQRCEVCTVNEVLAGSTLATIKLLDAVPDSLPDDSTNHEVERAKQPLQHQMTRARHHHRVLGATLTFTGIAVAAAGIALYATQNHATYGVATAAAGGGLALGGVVSLAF